MLLGSGVCHVVQIDTYLQGNTIGTYGFTATVPTVIEELGYSSANAQLLTIPIYVFAMSMYFL